MSGNSSNTARSIKQYCKLTLLLNSALMHLAPPWTSDQTQTTTRFHKTSFLVVLQWIQLQFLSQTEFVPPPYTAFCQGLQPHLVLFPTFSPPWETNNFSHHLLGLQAPIIRYDPFDFLFFQQQQLSPLVKILSLSRGYLSNLVGICSLRGPHDALAM